MSNLPSFTVQSPSAPPLREPLIVLGIETSCDETAAAVIRLSQTGPEILSNIVHSQDDHAQYGGVVPELAARAHVSFTDHIITKALTTAGITDLSSQLDGIAVTAGPGLVGGVMVGLMTAKAMALSHGVALIPVNHLAGHALSARLTEDIPFPYLLLLVSGGHTQLLLVSSPTSYTRLGTTIDDAAGEAFDKTAKLLGLGQPGGPRVQAAAAKGNPDKYDLPRPLLNRAGCDFSFSGLKTAVRVAAENHHAISEQDRYDLAASFQRAAAAHLMARTKRAMQQLTQTNQLVIAGGVAANTEIRDVFEHMCQTEGWDLFVPPLEFCTDNGAMIALAGAELLRLDKEGRQPLPAFEDNLALAPRPRWPLDDTPSGARHGGGKKGPKA